MTAALKGFTLGCFHSRELDNLLQRIDPYNNYQRYRELMICDTSALHFLLPAEGDLRHEDPSAMVRVLDASKGYGVLRIFFLRFFNRV